MKLGHRLGLLVLFGLSSSCARVAVPEETWPFAPKLLYVEVLSAALQDGGFELELALNNLSAQHLVVLLPEITCGRGTGEGQLQPGLQGRQQLMHARAHTRTRHRLICRVANRNGPLWVTFTRVWGNPSGDRVTPEGLLARDLQWRFTPARE